MIGAISYVSVLVLLAVLFWFLPRLWMLREKRLREKGISPDGNSGAQTAERFRKVGLILLVLSLILEVFVCNFHSFHLLFGGYEYTQIDFTDRNVTVEGLWQPEEQQWISEDSGATGTVTVKNFGKPVGSVHLICEFPEEVQKVPGATTIQVFVDAIDETHSQSYRRSVATGTVIRGDERSSYLTVNLSGDVEKISIRMKTAEGKILVLRGIEFNRPIPFRLSVIRLVLLVFGILALYALATLPCLRRSLEENRSGFGRVAMALTVVFLLLAVVMSYTTYYDKTGGLSSGFLNKSGNQISQELVDAFEAGQVSLLATPSDKLLELENPYDWSLRSAEEVSYKWDHLLFEGKYYSYYGIAPVLLLFLPYHALTGYYFPSGEAILLFGMLGILFLSLLYLEFAKRFCRKIPVNLLLSGLVILQVSSGVWYNFCSPLFYEIAQSSGFCFVTAGFWLLLRSGVVGDGEIRMPSTVLSVVCLALAVLCRPTLAVYCVASLFFYGFGFFKRLAAAKERYSGADKAAVSGRRRMMAGYLTAVILPYAIIGGAQMLYNFARFGSFFDFGIQYSLTINDFTRSQYHTDLAMIGFYNFLFAFPKITAEFPFVASNFSTLGVSGYYYIANRNAVGIFFRALPALGYLGVVPAWRSLEKKQRRMAALLLIPTCILAPLVIIFSIWESGYGVRYCADFTWQIVLGGMAILFLLYDRLAERQTKRILEIGFVVAAVLALWVNGAMLWEYFSKSGYLEAAALRFARLFDFWR